MVYPTTQEEQSLKTCLFVLPDFVVFLEKIEFVTDEQLMPERNGCEIVEAVCIAMPRLRKALY